MFIAWEAGFLDMDHAVYCKLTGSIPLVMLVLDYKLQRFFPVTTLLWAPVST